MNSAGALINSGPLVNTNAPKAYINYLLFDEKYTLVDAGFTQISESALETGGGVPHQLLQLQTIIKEPGFIYIYLSNENDKLVDVFFDDLKITHHHGPVVQSDSYYPFGLTFNSFYSNIGISENDLFNGIERQQDLDLMVDMAFYRSYDPTIGRWMQVDPKPNEQESLYVGFANNPVKFSDFLGDTIKYQGRSKEVSKMKQNDQELAKTRLGKRLLKKLDKSKNIHNSIGVPNGGDDAEGKEIRRSENQKILDGEISEMERDVFMTAGNTVLTESDINYFRGNGYDGKDSDGTGVGSSMYWGDHSNDEFNGLANYAHERVHQLHSDKRDISKEEKGNKSQEEIRTQRKTYKIIQQYNKKTGRNVPVQKNYY